MPLLDPTPGKLPRYPRTQLVASAVWLVLSAVFLDFAWHRVIDLRAAHRAVNPVHYLQVAFWIALIPFWLWQGKNAWQAYRRANDSEGR